MKIAPLFFIFIFLFTNNTFSVYNPDEEILKKDPLEVVDKIIKDIKGMKIYAGIGRADFSTNAIFFNDNLSKSLIRASNLLSFNFGLEIGKSYVDITVSPYLNNNQDCLYLEALSGAWVFDTADLKDKNVFFGAKAGIYFYGSILSFTTPFSYFINRQVSQSEAGNANGGLGIVLVGSGVRGEGYLQFNDIYLSTYRIQKIYLGIGLYFNMGAMLPFSPMLGYGFTGPCIEITLIPDFLSLYFNARLLNMGFEVSHWETGIIFSF